MAIVTGQTEKFNCATGTSAATPISAGVIGMINDIRLNKGLKSLGFLNPLIYQSAAVQDAFLDVTEGNNSTCGFNA